MTSINDVQVSSAKRTITLSLTPEEAQEFLEWFRNTPAAPPPYVGKLFFGTVAAIAQNREYGGH